MGREVEKEGEEMGAEGVDRICDRLSRLPDLYLPHSLATRSEPVSQPERKSHLATLLRRDAAVFLERYGTSLNTEELQQFEVLQDDYEVNWHLKSLKSAINPSAEDQRSRAATIQNRRLAYMNRLVQDGQYFSEDAMRMRSPLLHYEHVGQYQDPATRDLGARPGERYSDVLIRQSEEAFIQRRLREERVEAGIPVGEEPVAVAQRYQEDEDSEFEEEVDTESEDEETNAQARPTVQTNETSSSGGDHTRVQRHSNGTARAELPSEECASQPSEDPSGEPPEESGAMVLSAADLSDKMEDFTRVMQEKFLSGMDGEHVDYRRIDNDAALDDDWMPEITRDAEEKYFEED